ncbi:uncharacterized protein [Nicotiana tomentosiformis]|uniref:uncharacterized protein n=1 Tax=Nicotiana tomentosiformis TaxID=4098 RepID=UPI00388C4771
MGDASPIYFALGKVWWGKKTGNEKISIVNGINGLVVNGGKFYKEEEEENKKVLRSYFQRRLQASALGIQARQFFGEQLSSRVVAAVVGASQISSGYFDEEVDRVSKDTKWVGSKARDADGFKLWYSGHERGKNGVGILVDRELRELVVEVRRAPQVGLDEEIKRHFWESLDGLVRGIPHTEQLFIGGDFNSHIGATSGGYDGVHGGFGFGVRNEGGTSLLDCATTFDLVIVNSCFLKREEQLVTFQNSLAKAQIDYLLLRKCDRISRLSIGY